MALLSEPNIEGHYRLISHNERGEAIYAKLDAAGVAEWVRNWREATTFLTLDHAVAARADARARDPDRDINIAHRFQDWPKRRPVPQPAEASQ